MDLIKYQHASKWTRNENNCRHKIEQNKKNRLCQTYVECSHRGSGPRDRQGIVSVIQLRICTGCTHLVPLLCTVSPAQHVTVYNNHEFSCEVWRVHSYQIKGKIHENVAITKTWFTIFIYNLVKRKRFIFINCLPPVLI